MRLVALVLILSLGGCAGAVPWNPQGYAGINRGTVDLVDGMPTHIDIWGGKENETVAVSAKMPNGLEFTYTAGGVKAFDGQKVRAAVETAVSEDVRIAAPQIVDKIVEAVLKALNPVPGL